MMTQRKEAVVPGPGAAVGDERAPAEGEVAAAVIMSPARRRVGAAPRLLRFGLKSESLGVGLLLAALLVTLGVTHAGFYSTYNLQSIAANAAIFAVVGFSQLAVLSIGQLNLAVSAIAVSTAMLLADLGNERGSSVVVAVIAAVLLGTAMGGAQGVPIAYGGLNPFIVTLGMASLYTGAMFVMAGTATYPTVNAGLGDLGVATFWTVPVIAWLAVLVALLVALLFRMTVSGRELLATGASYRAAVFSAIHVKRRVVLAHALSGLLAAIAAVFAVANLAEADTSLGQAWLLPSFLAPVLGGTLLTGGRITVVGTLLGAVLLGLLQSALVVLGLSQYWYQVGLGAVLLLAVFAGQARQRLAVKQGV